MERYTKKDKDGRYYIESVNGKLESNIFGHTYGKAIDRFAELENVDALAKADGVTDTKDGRKKTNFDKIKEMTVDELAALLGKVSICSHIQYEDRQFCEKRGTCTDCVKAWLESEVE